MGEGQGQRGESEGPGGKAGSLSRTQLARISELEPREDECLLYILSIIRINISFILMVWGEAGTFWDRL